MKPKNIVGITQFLFLGRTATNSGRCWTISC